MTTADVLKAILQRVEEDENTLCYEVEGIMDLLLAHSKAGGFVIKWAHRMTIATYVSEVAQLVHRASGFHFTVKKPQLSAFIRKPTFTFWHLVQGQKCQKFIR